MKKILAAAVIALGACGAHAAQPDSISSAVATFIASNFQLTLDNALADLASTGVKFDAPLVKQLVIERMAQPYDAEAHHAAVATIENAVAAVAAADSEALLAAAAARPGAQTLDDGLIIETVAAGEGANPTPESIITMRYRAALPDGTVVDEISPEQPPMTSRVADFCPGVAQGLTLMQPGGEYILTMPGSLAYGSEGVPGVIPPDCAMQFIINLISIQTTN